SGRTKFPVLSRKVIRNFIDSAVIAFSDVPLKLSILAGLAISVLAFVHLLWMLLQTLLGNNVPAQSPGMLAVLVLAGMQLMCIGILGLYIGSIFLEVKMRPNYIIRDTFGFPGREVATR